MPDPIDISQLDAFSNVINKVIQSSNKTLMAEFSQSFRTIIAEEGSKLIKESGFSDFDIDIEDSVVKGTTKALTESEKRQSADRKVQQQILQDYLSKVVTSQRVQSFEFNKEVGTKAIKGLAQKIALPGEAAGFKETFNKAIVGQGFASGFQRYRQIATDAAKKLAESGENLSELFLDEEELLKLRLKILKEVSLKVPIANEEYKLLETQLIKSTKQEIIASKQKAAFSEKYSKAMEQASWKLSNIPVIGSALSKGFGKISEDPRIKGPIIEKLAKFGPKAAAPGEGGVMAGLGQGLKLTAGLAALAAIAALLWKIIQYAGTLLKTYIDLNKEIVISSGFTARQSIAFEDMIKDIGETNKELFGGKRTEGTKAATEAVGALSKEMGGMTGVTRESVEMVTLLGLRMGISADAAAKMVFSWRHQLGLTEIETRNLIEDLKVGAEKYGLSFNQLLADSAENAETLALWAGGTEKSYAKAVIEARRLGTTLESQSRTAEQFLSFEDAINNAFMLQFLSSKQINAQSLYAMANYGEIGDLQKYIVDLYSETVAKQKLPVYQIREFARVAGMSVTELKSMASVAKDQARLIKELEAKGINLPTDFQKRALQEIELKTKLKAPEISVQAITERATEIEKAATAQAADIQRLTDLMHVKEIKSQTDLFLAKIFGVVDSIAGWLVGPFWKLLEPTLIALNKWLGSPIDAMTEEIGDPLYNAMHEIFTGKTFEQINKEEQLKRIKQMSDTPGIKLSTPEETAKKLREVEKPKLFEENNFNESLVKTDKGVELSSLGVDTRGSLMNLAAETSQIAPSLRVTSTTGGEHVPGSKHLLGRAVDAMAKEFWDNEKLSQFTQFANKEGFAVLNELIKPKNATKDWGPHLHLQKDEKTGLSKEDINRHTEALNNNTNALRDALKKKQQNIAVNIDGRKVGEAIVDIGMSTA